jgi:hypothetical protein
VPGQCLGLSDGSCLTWEVQVVEQVLVALNASGPEVRFALGAVQPKAVMWPWHQKRMAVARNDFFQFGRGDCLALGGAPHYALCLNGDLEFGSSGDSDTFGSPCLAGSEEFEIGRVELWGLV